MLPLHAGHSRSLLALPANTTYSPTQAVIANFCPTIKVRGRIDRVLKCFANIVLFSVTSRTLTNFPCVVPRRTCICFA